MTQHKHRALTSAITVLSLAIVAAPLTIDQRGSVGISQALANGSHHDRSASRARSGESSPNDVVADANEKKAASAASQSAAFTQRVNALDAAELHPSSELAKAAIEREEAALQAMDPNDAAADKAESEASQDAAAMRAINGLLKESSGSVKAELQTIEKNL